MDVRGAGVPVVWNYGAVERALREADARGSACIFQPKVGKVFDSTEEAFEFINMFSWETGFGVRFGRSRTNKAGRRTMQDIVCACEGRATGDDTRSIRCGCSAMVRLLRKDDDSWFISRFVLEHSHPMSAGCGERRQWKSHSRIDKMTRDLVRHLRDNNVQISRVCNIVGSMHGAGSYVPFSRQSIRSLCGRLAQESIEGDMAKTMEIFEGMKTADPSMVLKLDLDGSGRVRSMFWSHGASRDSFSCFGDAITFDTTYRTNLYNLPFGLFVGVNHHFQSILFGAVLLTEETTEAFQWAFRTFVEAMGGEPCTMLTDQCQAMKAAIATELPRTRHRWCKWHVLKKAKESLGPVYTKNSRFKADLHELLDDIICVKEFETRWASLIETYKLQGNQFLARAYDNREMWAKPYFAETFCAGMTSTQRSESANHMLKTYVPRAAPMHLFVSQYNRMIADRIAEEGKEEHATKQVCRLMKIGVPIEHYASRMYTRSMFERFDKELFRSGAYKCAEIGSAGDYHVSLIDKDIAKPQITTDFVVRRAEGGSMYHCDCKMFEHVGMPCRHILKVLVTNGMTEMPGGLILKRWSRNAKDGLAVQGRSAAKQVGADPSSLHHVMYAAAMELVGMSGSSRQAFDVGLRYVSKAKEAISSMTVMPGDATEMVAAGSLDQASFGGSRDGSLVTTVAAPPRVRSRGRPKEKRYKSPIESPGARKKKRKVAGVARDAGETLERRSKKVATQTQGKIRDSPSKRPGRRCGTCGSPAHYTWNCSGSHDGETETQVQRKCKLCGEVGHYRSTCGRKSSYKTVA